MKRHCFVPTEILLPAEGINMEQWASVACDQFTSQPDYWEEAGKVAAGSPSTLRIMLPEAYLDRPRSAEYVQTIQASMKQYLDEVLTRKVNGFIYVERTTESGVRQGLVGAVDLEQYSFDRTQKPPIRPTEKTVTERIPPRLEIRRGAVVETPHVMMLADDPACTVVEPIGAIKEQLRPVYSGKLMLGGGSIAGWAVEDPALIDQIVAAVDALDDQAVFDQRYPGAAGQTPITLAVGDGNHSLATAKAYWDELKLTLSPEELEDHPARYCLVEVCNVYCPAIQVEPIHRVLFGGSASSVLLCLAEYIDYHGGAIRAGAEAAAECSQKIRMVLPCRSVDMGICNPWTSLTVATIEDFLDEYLNEHQGVRIDYIHGAETASEMATKGGVGILLPPLRKEDLFRGVAEGGVLPRKAFSMGHATEKRYYLECRKIVK